MKQLLFITAFVFNTVFAFAGSADWAKLANGKHSLQALGTDFYVNVPVRPVAKERIQLSFVNRKLVDRLGLELPTNPAETEAMLTKYFGWEVDPTKTSKKTWMASHYMDGSKKGPGEAMGDGRALWTGELQLKTAEGKILYIDGIQKGVGITPFAWLNNPGHNDGRQNTGELIRSGIKSIADVENQLDSTGDILGFTITHENGEKTSMTLRVGRQTRPAHIAFHADNEANEKKMMDYIVVRDLGLPLNTVVTRELFVQWQKAFAKNNGEDTARVYSLNAFFEQPTKGNKTTSGGSIDLNGRQYMDAYHVKLTHLYHRLAVADQISYQRGYIDIINGYLDDANYPHMESSPGLTDQMKALFNKTFKETAAKLQLHRLGLSEQEIEQLSPELRSEFFKAADALMRATGKRKVDLIMDNKNVTPAAFEMRKVLKGTMAAYAISNYELQTAAIKELFVVNKAWGSATDADDHLNKKAQYLAAVRAVIKSLGGNVKPEWIANAKIRTQNDRHDFTHDSLWWDWANPIREMAESGNQDWVAISDRMEKAAETLIDHDIPVRKSGMLKPVVAPRVCADIFAKAG